MTRCTWDPERMTQVVSWLGYARYFLELGDEGRAHRAVNRAEESGRAIHHPVWRREAVKWVEAGRDFLTTKDRP